MQRNSVSLTPEKLSSAILLERVKDKIIFTWSERARKLFPAAENQSVLALENALPQLVDQVINALALVGFTVNETKEVSQEHGKQRASLGGYSLKQVLGEMKILRETIFQVLEKEGGELSQRDRDIILNSLESGLIATGSEFVKVQMNEKEKELRQTESTLYNSLSTIEKLESEQKLRDLFVATLTHDLKTPLTAIKLSSQVLETFHNIPDGAKKLLSRITSSVDRAESMINSLLDANQMRSGNFLEFNMVEYDLNQQMTKLIEDMSQLYSGVNFQFTPSPEPILCKWAFDKINRAIENLLSNAVKYGDSSRPIRIFVNSGQNEIGISVHNFGKSIPLEEQSAVFEPFFRSKTVRFGNQKGWGLGLTLVQGIVESHGGRVALISNAVDGTTFSLVLPKNPKLI